MTGKREPDGMFAAIGRAADESFEIAEAIRGGRLTRPEFEAWYLKRRAEGTELVITLREKTVELTKPVQTALKHSVEVLRSAAPRRARRSHRRNRRSKSK